MAPGGEPTLGDILAAAFADAPPIAPREAELVAGRTLAGAAASFYGIPWADAWHFVTHVPDTQLPALTNPEGWSLFGAAMAKAFGLNPELLPVTVH